MPCISPSNLFPPLIKQCFPRLSKESEKKKKKESLLYKRYLSRYEARMRLRLKPGAADSERSGHRDGAGMKRGEAGLGGIHWGGSSINTGPLISGNLWGE